MTRVLIVFSTRKGHTRRVAEFLLERFVQTGAKATMQDARDGVDEESLDQADAVVLAASVLFDRHQKEMRQFAAAHRRVLETKTTAFVSVSLSASGISGFAKSRAKEASSRRTTQKYLERFFAKTNWRPDHAVCVAGALPYRSQYGFFLRVLMQQIARINGLPTDPSSDHEFTDWAALETFADKFREAIS